MEPADAAGPRKPRPSTSTTTAPSTEASEIAGRRATGAAETLPGSSRRQPLSSVAAAAVTASLLAAAGLGGGALLAWWAVAFRRANAMLWMVPAGLVLLGTSFVAWLSVLASGTAATAPPPPPR